MTKKASFGKITIRLKKSPSHGTIAQRECVTGLGLKRIQQERTLENSPCVRGMIKKVIHMVDVVSEEK